MAYTDKSKGYKGISIFILYCNSPGITITKLKKEGIKSSGTGEVAFEDCLVPEKNLLGLQEGIFDFIMANLSERRIGLVGNMVGIAQTVYEASLIYAK